MRSVFTRSMCRHAAAAALAVTAVPSLVLAPALAHPHVFPLATVTAIFDDAGRLSAVHEMWSFDADFSGPIALTIDDDGNGSLSGEETAKALAPHGPLAWIAAGNYFTRLTVGGRVVPNDPPRGAAVSFATGKLLVAFTLPLREPIQVAFDAGIDVFDPEFYLDFEFDSRDLEATDLPKGCVIARREKPNVDPVALMIIRRLGLAADPAVLTDPASGYAMRIAIQCGVSPPDALAQGMQLLAAPKPVPLSD